MASKSSFFALSGNQAAFAPTTITVGGTFTATGPGLYWVKRSPSTVLTFSLPTGASVSPFVEVLYIKDILGDAETAPITIVDPTGFLIDGQAQLVLNTPYAATTLVWNGNGWSQVA